MQGGEDSDDRTRTDWLELRDACAWRTLLFFALTVSCFRAPRAALACVITHGVMK